MAKTTLDLTSDKDALSLAWSEIMDARFAPAGQRFVPDHLRDTAAFTDTMYDYAQKIIVPGLIGGLGGRAKAYETLDRIAANGDKFAIGTAELATSLLTRAHEIEQARANNISSLPSFDSVDDYKRYAATAKETGAKEVAQSKVPYEPSAGLAMPDSFVARFMGTPETATPEQPSFASLSATAVQIPDTGRAAPEKEASFPIFNAMRDEAQKVFDDMSKRTGVNFGSVGSSINIPLDTPRPVAAASAPGAAKPVAAAASASAPAAPSLAVASPSFAQASGMVAPPHVPAPGSFEAGLVPLDLSNLTARASAAPATPTTTIPPAANKKPITLIDIPLPTVDIHIPGTANKPEAEAPKKPLLGAPSAASPAASAPAAAPAVPTKDPHERVSTEKGRRSTADKPLETPAPAKPPAATLAPAKPIDDVLVVVKKGDSLSEIAELQTKEMRELRKIVRQELGGKAKETDVLNALAVTLAEKSGIQHIDKIKTGQKIAAIDADDIKEAIGKMKANGTIDANGRIPLAGPPRDVSELLAPATPAEAKSREAKGK